VVLGGAVLYIVHTVEDEWLWRGAEYDKLTSLRAGFNLTYFEDQLGRPGFGSGAVCRSLTA
jgi:hypothetical protein